MRLRTVLFVIWVVLWFLDGVAWGLVAARHWPSLIR